MSSVRNNLKISTSYENVKDIKAKEIGELVTMVQNTFKEMLFDQHRKLLQDVKNIKVREWRTHQEPMQVISGAMGRKKNHFEVPPSKDLPKEMEQFIN